MYLPFLKILSAKTAYIQIWSDRIKVTDIKTGSFYDENALVSLIKDNKNEMTIIEEIGDSVLELSKGNRKIIEPFKHPRVLISDFSAGEKVVQHAFQKIYGHSFLSPTPIAIIQPMEKLEGGLTLIEDKALRELAIGAGAHKVFIHTGSTLSSHEAINLVKQKKIKKEEAGFLNLIVYIIVLGLIFLYFIKQ